jgi:endonuclease/exonuclease/phosphatase family metal-dependent hydrolase
MAVRNRYRVGLMLSCLLLAACATPERYAQPEISHHVNGGNESGATKTNKDNSLRVMTLNIAHARGTGFNQMFQATHTARANLDSIALLLKQQAPDIVSLQEADRQSFWNGNFNHVSFLAEEASFQQSLSGTHVNSLGLDYGTALIAKLDLASPESITFNPVDPSGSKGFVVSSFQWPGEQCIEVDVVSVHLDFASAQTRREQASEIISTLKSRNRPVILMGDFNSDWKRTNSAVRILADELGLHSFKPDARGLITFPKYQRRLDWILVSPEFNFQSYRVVETAVSDHLGVVADLDINRSCG